MGLFLILIRFPLIVLHITIGLVILVFFPKENLKLRPVHHKISQVWMKVLSFLFGFNIIKMGNLDHSVNTLISNHVTLFDIIILQSITPVNFVAKSEIKSWPIIGHLSSKTGTIFIRRGDSTDNDNVIKKMRDYIMLGKKIIIFPEGRIGDGKQIKKFHSKLLESVVGDNKKTQPVLIHYPKDYPRDNTNDLSICWADKSQTLFNISIKCMSRFRTNVLVKFHKTIQCNQQPYDLAKQSFDLVKNSRDEITNVNLGK